MPSGPNKLTLDYLRNERGLEAYIVEHWNAHAKVRQDFLGFADIVALDEANRAVIAVQATTDSNRAARRKKIQGCRQARLWALAGNSIELITWGKHKRPNARGVEQEQWTPSIETVSFGE